MFTLVTVIVVGVACLIVGAIFSTPIMRALADIKGDIRKEYQATITDLTAAKTKAESDLHTATAAIQAEADKVAAGLKARAEAAEADLAALKRFLPTSITAPAPVVVADPTAAPVPAFIPPAPPVTS